MAGGALQLTAAYAVTHGSSPFVRDPCKVIPARRTCLREPPLFPSLVVSGGLNRKSVSESRLGPIRSPIPGSACEAHRRCRRIQFPSRYVIAAMLSEAFGSNPFNILPHVLALLVAYVLAIPIGWNREQEERSAGLRTFPLVAVATCGFIQASETMFADHPEGLARVMEGLITGMGFIGGGAILRQQDSVKGTATAASLWVTGAIGAAVGPWQLRRRGRADPRHDRNLVDHGAAQAAQQSRRESAEGRGHQAKASIRRLSPCHSLELPARPPIWPSMVPLSVLDLAPIVEGGDAGQALRNRLDLARHAERLGYRRFWMAEHHSMPGIASAATAVGTRLCRRRHLDDPHRRRRDHAAEPCAAGHRRAVRHARSRCFPAGSTSGSAGRRAPTGRPPMRCAATSTSDENQFPQRRVELHGLFQRARAAAVRAIPGEGLDIPVWILGSSLFGAQLAAMLGLPYAFASHFAPADDDEAIRVYRETLPALGAARPALCHARLQRLRRRQRRGGGAPRRHRSSRPSSRCAPAIRRSCRRR